MSCAYLVYCVSLILLGMSLAMDGLFAMYRVILAMDHMKGFVLYSQVCLLKHHVVKAEMSVEEYLHTHS